MMIWSGPPTTRSTAWQPGFGPGISAKLIHSQASCRRAPSGLTAITYSMRRYPSAATNSLVGAERCDVMPSIATPRRRLFARPCDRLSRAVHGCSSPRRDDFIKQCEDSRVASHVVYANQCGGAVFWTHGFERKVVHSI